MARTFLALDSFVIAGRGLVFAGMQPDPVFDSIGEDVEIDGRLYRITGIETYLGANHWPPKPGHPVGLLVEDRSVDAFYDHADSCALCQEEGAAYCDEAQTLYCEIMPADRPTITG